MAKRKENNAAAASKLVDSITKVTVSGYKSVTKEQSIEIRPLTILAGANSSGKSSMMQPVLLLKQTLEATYDPGPLLLSGPNVKFTLLEQLLSRTRDEKQNKGFHIGISRGPLTTTVFFRRHSKVGLEIVSMVLSDDQAQLSFRLKPTMVPEELSSEMITFANERKRVRDALSESEQKPHFLRLEVIINLANSLGLPELPDDYKFSVFRNRCFLDIGTKLFDELTGLKISGTVTAEDQLQIRQMIHLPGLRGNPERAFPVTAVGPTFPGVFQDYTASVIAQWQADKNNEKLSKLGKDLERLGLTWNVSANRINDTQVEIQVGRLPRPAKGRLRDMVNIADVGVGVSQTLPVLVALLVAEPGQMVYIEEPEIHLHPRAQSAMAEVLADAAQRGVRVVIETHSQLLLLGIQTLVAEGKLAPDLVKLHWFRRLQDGSTEITSADLDENGAFGDWPEDFGEVTLEAESRYLDAAESQQPVH